MRVIKTLYIKNVLLIGLSPSRHHLGSAGPWYDTFAAGEPWLDDIDVDDNGWPQPKAQTLREKLAARGLGPDEATLHFVGVVTNRCVASTLLHGVSRGYEAVLLEGGCCAADDQQHLEGVKSIREKGGEAVDVRP